MDWELLVVVEALEEALAETPEETPEEESLIEEAHMEDEPWPQEEPLTTEAYAEEVYKTQVKETKPPESI